MFSEGFSRPELKKEEEPKRVYIELGAGRQPVPAEGKAFSENDVYVGIDIKEKALKIGSKATEDRQHSSKNQNTYFVRGDATKLPLGSEISDEVFMRNILGDPGIEEETKESFLDEAWRITKNGGCLIITEKYTPRKLKEVRKLLKQHGFVVKQTEKIEGHPSQFSTLDERFPYRVVAQKVSRQRTF